MSPRKIILFLDELSKKAKYKNTHRGKKKNKNG